MSGNSGSNNDDDEVTFPQTNIEDASASATTHQVPGRVDEGMDFDDDELDLQGAITSALDGVFNMNAPSRRDDEPQVQGEDEEKEEKEIEEEGVLENSSNDLVEENQQQQQQQRETVPTSFAGVEETRPSGAGPAPDADTKKEDAEEDFDAAFNDALSGLFGSSVGGDEKENRKSADNSIGGEGDNQSGNTDVINTTEEPMNQNAHTTPKNSDANLQVAMTTESGNADVSADQERSVESNDNQSDQVPATDSGPAQHEKRVVEEHEEDEENLNLDEAIESALGMVFNRSKDKEPQLDELSEAVDASEHRDLPQQEQEQEQEEDDLDSAITYALRQTMQAQAGATEVSSAADVASDQGPHSISSNFTIAEDVDDLDLEEVITRSLQDAFKASQKALEPDNEDMESAIADAFKSALKRSSELQSSHQGYNAAASAAAATRTTGGAMPDMAPTKFPFGDQSRRIISTPQKIPKQTNQSLHLPATDHLDLESLQMKDILQDAMRMATEKPHELLSELELGDMESAEYMLRSYRAKSEPKKNLPPKPVVLPSRLENRSVDSSGSKPSERPITHREQKLPTQVSTQVSTPSSTASRSDELHAKPKTSIFSNTDVKSQISSVMQALSSKINNGELNDSEILLAIRQITEEIAAGGSLSQFFKKPMTVETFNNEYSEAMRRNLLRSTRDAVTFLQRYSEGEPEEDKAVTVLSNFFDQLVPFGLVEQRDLSEGQVDFMSAVCNSTANTIVGNIPSSASTPDLITIIDRFRSNSPESRRKTRLGNRERKKKWREENAERNKDNELRTRVLKRASAKFGSQESQVKQEWIESEISKRKAKRVTRPNGEEDKPTLEDAVKREPETIADEAVAESTTADTTTNTTTLAAPSGTLSQIAKDENFSKPIIDVFNFLYRRSNTKKRSSQIIATSALIAALALSYVETFSIEQSRAREVVETIIRRELESRNTGFGSLKVDSASDLLRANNGPKRHFTAEMITNFKRFKPSTEEESVKVSTALTRQKPARVVNSNDAPPARPSLQLPRVSPFISHKVLSGDNPAGATRPKSFQKPTAFKRPSPGTGKVTGFGFPKLYTASSS
ncbi:uncharacterized protein LODBEIA_P07840 [Lodderomyces beijingensis]|uniref:DUF3020 domain-containing protein n=1 Tax=Lodderomyces beijingensis TaxID=1775926 RepID=A0ABP0ZHC8_9ASCO